MRLLVVGSQLAVSTYLTCLLAKKPKSDHQQVSDNVVTMRSRRLHAARCSDVGCCKNNSSGRLRGMRHCHIKSSGISKWVTPQLICRLQLPRAV
jgi:hypothetical protein